MNKEARLKCCVLCCIVTRENNTEDVVFSLSQHNILKMLCCGIRTDSANSPYCYVLPILLSIFVFTIFIFFHFLVFGSVRQIKVTYVSFRAHVIIASRTVSSTTSPQP